MSIGDQPMQCKHNHIPRQECLSQRIRDQVQMNTKIAHRLQADEQDKEENQLYQTVRQLNRDWVKQSTQVPHR